MCIETSNGRGGTSNMLSRLWRAIFQVALYLAGTNITEALLFLPTLLILFVPSFILDVSRAIAISLLASIYGKKGQYTTADGQRYPYSLTAYYDDLDFRAPAPLKRHTTSFPSKKALSLTNAQVLMSAISVSYEEWPVARGILNSWGHGAHQAHWIAGYQVNNISWRDDTYLLGLPGQTRRIKLAIRVFIARIGEDSIIVTFQGTDPFSLADWNTDWDLYSNEHVGRYGRVHPGFHVALGLDKDLQPLQNVRTCYEVTGEGNAVPGSEPLSLFTLLQMRLQMLARSKPNAEVFVAGHSMGGALAAIFAAALRLNAPGPLVAVGPQVKAVYTIGQPRFGDYRFVTEVEQALHSTLKEPTYIRIVNINDIVPAMPPAGSQDVGATSYQHGGFLMYISLFGNIMPQREQPIITPARASIVAALTAFQSLSLWLAHWVPSMAAGSQSRVSGLMVLTRFAALATFFPIGIVQHIPANYHQAIKESRPTEWQAEINREAAAKHTLFAQIRRAASATAHNLHDVAQKAISTRHKE